MNLPCESFVQGFWSSLLCGKFSTCQNFTFLGMPSTGQHHKCLVLAHPKSSLLIPKEVGERKVTSRTPNPLQLIPKQYLLQPTTMSSIHNHVCSRIFCWIPSLLDKEGVFQFHMVQHPDVMSVCAQIHSISDPLVHRTGTGTGNTTFSRGRVHNDMHATACARSLYVYMYPDTGGTGGALQCGDLIHFSPGHRGDHVTHLNTHMSISHSLLLDPL